MVAKPNEAETYERKARRRIRRAVRPTNGRYVAARVFSLNMFVLLPVSCDCQQAPEQTGKFCCLERVALFPMYISATILWDVQFRGSTHPLPANQLLGFRETCFPLFLDKLLSCTCFIQLSVPTFRHLATCCRGKGNPNLIGGRHRLSRAPLVLPRLFRIRCP